MADSEASRTAPTATSSGIPAEPIIAAFGGVRPMAGKLGVPVSTVQGWKARGVIPAARQGEVRAAAESLGLDLAELAPAAARQSERRPAATTDPLDSDATPAIDLPHTPEVAQDWFPLGERGPWLVGAAAGAIVVIVVLIGALLGRAFWPPPKAAGPDPELVGLRADLASATTRLEALENRPAPAATDLTPLETTLEGLARELRSLRADLEAQVEPLAASARLRTEQAEALERRGDRLSQSLEDLNARQAELAARLAGLDAKLTASPAVSPAELSALSATAADLGDRLNRANERLSALEALDQEVEELHALSAAAADLGRRLDQANERLSALEALDQEVEELRAARLSDQARLVADYYDLKRTVDGGQAYLDKLDVLRARLADRPDLLEILSPLGGSAQSGIASRSELRADFEETARQVAIASAGGEAGGLMSDIKRHLAALVTIRPKGAVTGEAPLDFVSRAETKLEAGDLGGAVDELDNLDGEARSQVEPWLAKARARLAADGALAALAARLIARPTADGG